MVKGGLVEKLLLISEIPDNKVLAIGVTIVRKS